jgi:hypothetical protein
MTTITCGMKETRGDPPASSDSIASAIQKYSCKTPTLWPGLPHRMGKKGLDGWPNTFTVVRAWGAGSTVLEVMRGCPPRDGSCVVRIIQLQ